jgi:hypothetical protein
MIPSSSEPLVETTDTTARKVSRDDRLATEREKIAQTAEADAKKDAALAQAVADAEGTLARRNRLLVDHRIRSNNRANGQQRTYEKKEAETLETTRAREHSNRIRNWIEEIRYDISGIRRAKGNDSPKVRLFDSLYKKWARKGRPANGVLYTFEALLESSGLQRATLYRILKDWEEREIISRQRDALHDQRGGRGAVRYSFPKFPTREKFEPFFDSTFE